MQVRQVQQALEVQLEQQEQRVLTAAEIAVLTLLVEMQAVAVALQLQP